jgi:hypothetical protein
MENDDEFDRAMVLSAMQVEAGAAKAGAAETGAAEAVAAEAAASDADAAVVDAAGPVAKQGAVAAELEAGDRAAGDAGAADAAAVAAADVAAADMAKVKVVAEWMAEQAEKRGSGWGYCEAPECLVMKAHFKEHMERNHPKVVSTECATCKKKFWWAAAATVHECPKKPLKRSTREVVVEQMISQQEILRRIEATLARLKQLAETDKINQD